jgi:hypothetical protein
LAAPLAGSPKSQFHPVIVPDAAGMVDELLLKSTAVLSQAVAE